ncbi:MAG: hypothetical protein CMJ26_07985 [Phycisphaerae bacterium]|nr:hypothetical protein [Phycisphaerae bacterium]|tara:strand:+ start:10543 stop:11208 length:666 start_codon:yes stop_codon:yes gene_type:complete
MRIPLLLLFIISLSQQLGCDGSKTNSLDLSLQEYNKGQWRIAEMWAKKELTSGMETHKAQYMLGLCEFQLQDLNAAEQWFAKASTASDKEVKGKATAMLGVIASNNGEFDKAEKAYATASYDLEGKDRTEANARSGITSSSGNFTLQFGAYRSKANAQAAMNDLAVTIKQGSLGSIEITEEDGSLGKTMFLVQAGHFATRKLAAARRDKGDLPPCIVVVSP